MGRTYYCCLDLDAQHEQFLRESMDELSRYMTQQLIGVAHTFEELPRTQMGTISQAFDSCSSFGGILVAFVKHRTSISRLLVLCSPLSKITGLVKAHCPSCVWGATQSDIGLALAYPPDGDPYAKYTIWHEALHLLGAEDCYRLPDEGPTCGLPNCIMQYAHPAHGYGQGLPLCRANIELVKKRVAEMQQGHSSDTSNGLQ